MQETMKVLFVCVANVGRSQVAEALFNKLSSQRSVSAGTQADEIIARTNPPSKMLKDANSTGIPYMLSEGVDISEKLRKQVTEEMVKEADKVIVIAQQNTWPDFLRVSEKATFWDIQDPVAVDPDARNAIFDEVRRRVQELVQEVG